MLIKVRNADLYRSWITYLERKGYRGYEARTYAFIYSNQDLIPPSV